MKTKINFAIAMLSLVCLSAVPTLADGPNPQDGQKGKRGDMQRNRAGAQNGGVQAGRARPGQGQMDPAKLVERMMAQFDKDGDQKLNATELTALLTQMRSRGRGMGGPSQRPGTAGQSDRANRMGKGRGGKAQAGEKGGDRPKRPGKESVS